MWLSNQHCAVSQLGEHFFFKLQNSKNQFFEKSKTYCVFWATRTIHTFLKSSNKTVIIRQGQKSDIATGKGSGAKFSLYRQTHCMTALQIRIVNLVRLKFIAFFFLVLRILRIHSNKFNVTTGVRTSTVSLTCTFRVWAHAAHEQEGFVAVCFKFLPRIRDLFFWC